MVHEEKINYMRIAAGMSGMGFSVERLDTLVSLYELVLKKRGKSSLDDVVHIIVETRNRESQREQERVKAELANRKVE